MMPPKDEMRAFLKLKYFPLEPGHAKLLPEGIRQKYWGMVTTRHNFYVDHLRRAPYPDEYKKITEDSFLDAMVQYHIDVAIW